MNVQLVKLSNEYKRHLTEMMDEWTASGEIIVPSAIRRYRRWNSSFREKKRLCDCDDWACITVSKEIGTR